MHTPSTTTLEPAAASGRNCELIESTARIPVALSRGLSAGAKLRGPRMFELTPRGVEFQETLPVAQVRDGLQLLALFKGSLHFWLADFIVQAQQSLTPEEVQSELVQLEFTQFDVDRAMAIALLPRGIRSDRLSSEHCWVLSRHELDAGQLTRWADEAVKLGLTAAELEESIMEGKVVRSKSGNGSSSGLVTIEGLRQRFESWWRRVDKDDPIDKWSRSRKEELYEELRPAMEAGIKIGRELGILKEATQ